MSYDEPEFILGYTEYMWFFELWFHFCLQEEQKNI
jgi:hypothetical protein